jgi:hypothetical protein
MIDDVNASASDGFIENVTEIAPEKAALREPLAITTLLFEPLREMLRVPGPGAHPVGANVKKVRRLGRRISDSAASAAGPFDQSGTDAHARKLRCEDRARSTATDYRDRDRPVRFRSQANSPGPVR